MIADWLFAVACNHLASQKSGSRTKAKAKCQQCMSALSFVFGRARQWNYAGSPHIRQTLDGIGGMQRGKLDLVRPERDLLVVFKFIAGLGDNSLLSDRDLMIKTALLLWFDMGCRAQMMRGIQPWGENLRAFDSKGARISQITALHRAEYFQFRYRFPKGGAEWSEWVSCYRCRASHVHFSGTAVALVCSVRTLSCWLARRHGVVESGPASAPNRETIRYGPSLFVHTGLKGGSVVYFPGSQNLAEFVHEWLVKSSFVPSDLREKSHLIRAHSESAVRSVALSQFSNEVIEARLLHGTATWAARYRCSPCTRLVQRVSALSKRGLLRYEEVLRL